MLIENSGKMADGHNEQIEMIRPGFSTLCTWMSTKSAPEKISGSDTVDRLD